VGVFNLNTRNMENCLSEITVSYHPIRKPEIAVKSSDDAYQIFRQLMSPETIQLKEEAICLYLNRSNCILGWYRVSSGGITGTVVDIRLILGVALKTAACAIILCHNHPSGALSPSSTDKELTEKLCKAAAVMDIKLLDHLIITASSFLSFKEEGLL
jgi:DNA repair protein RadC